MIAFIALLAESLIDVEYLALRLYFTADSVSIEVIVLGAFAADTIDPCFASEIIIDDFEEFWVLKIFRVQWLLGSACSKQQS